MTVKAIEGQLEIHYNKPALGDDTGINTMPIMVEAMRVPKEMIPDLLVLDKMEVWRNDDRPIQYEYNILLHRTPETYESIFLRFTNKPLALAYLKAIANYEDLDVEKVIPEVLL